MFRHNGRGQLEAELHLEVGRGGTLWGRKTSEEMGCSSTAALLTSQLIAALPVLQLIAVSLAPQ